MADKQMGTKRPLEVKADPMTVPTVRERPPLQQAGEIPSIEAAGLGPQRPGSDSWLGRLLAV